MVTRAALFVPVSDENSGSSPVTQTGRAAHFAVRYNDRGRRFFDRKAARRNRMIAIRAVAHKLAQAPCFLQRDRVEFDALKLFG